jgi:hypothetical protein
MSDRSVARSPRLTAHLRNAIAATREQAELAYHFAPTSYTYTAFIAARGAEALARKNKRVRASREPVPSSAPNGVNYRPPLAAPERHTAEEGKQLRRPDRSTKPETKVAGSGEPIPSRSP